MPPTPAIPARSFMFDPVSDAYGRRLALVFGNEFKGGRCPFYQKQCTHCDIGAGEGTGFDAHLNKQRLEFYKHHYAWVLPNTAHLVIYNSGSTLSRKEMSPETLQAILDYAASLKNCRVISFDSREAYITPRTVSFLGDNLRPDQQARVILGLESYNDEVRIGKLNKIMTKQAIEQVFVTLGRYDRKVGLDINILFQPPELTGQAAIEDAVQTVAYCLELARRYNVPIDFNFHPYYPSQKGLKCFPDHPRADLKGAVKAALLMKERLDAQNSPANLFIGWQDENHDQQQDIRDKELERYLPVFDAFNRTQDVAILARNQPRPHIEFALSLAEQP